MRDLLTAYLSPTDPPLRVREARQLQDAREATVQVDGHDVRVRSMGEGPEVLVAHGWSGGSDQMGFVAAALVDAGYRVILPDLPGHGQTGSFQPDGTSSFGDFARVVTRLVDEGAPHAIVGHSGGALAALMAMGEGAEVPRFVGLGMLPRLRESVDRFLDAHEATVEEREAFEDAGRVRFAGDIYARTNAYTAMTTVGARPLLIHDRDDEAVPIGEARALAASWDAATYIETERYGHHLILRRGDVSADVIDFLQR